MVGPGLRDYMARVGDHLFQGEQLTYIAVLRARLTDCDVSLAWMYPTTVFKVWFLYWSIFYTRVYDHVCGMLFITLCIQFPVLNFRLVHSDSCLSVIANLQVCCLVCDHAWDYRQDRQTTKFILFW